MSFFKKLFGNGESNQERKLSHPEQLRQGDFVKFKFFQSEASGKMYEVFKVNTYSYDGMNYPEMILKDKESNIIFMMVEEEDGEEYIGLSKKIPKAEIRNIIHQNTLDSILQDGTGITVKVQQKPDGFEKWIVDSYRETDEYRGHFSKGDARQDEDRRGEEFKSFLLTDPSDEFALEIEVYGSGELEMSATTYHDINVIEEILPGSLEG